MSFVTIGAVTTIACLNVYMKTYLYFFTLCTFFTKVGTENFHKNYAVTEIRENGSGGSPTLFRDVNEFLFLLPGLSNLGGSRYGPVKSAHSYFHHLYLSHVPFEHQ